VRGCVAGFSAMQMDRLGHGDSSVNAFLTLHHQEI